ncbi:VTT domain-containing protein [Oryzihumus leptocrescens]|uniref:Membrane-associated protein n=1 Tax=Oryzihumus leptocrescens TaxID=297536 RepID=A0A542Z7Z7_9MICO|nr:VTT domain-containing protein [Oryzihumus leptocrescens]TQL56457.1 membrane-associated protein [Oryzihumus leptocrescens]
MHSLGPQWLDPQYLLDHYGNMALWISALIIFAECGLFTAFLPGDSLLFTIGLFAALPHNPLGLPFWLVLVVLVAAAFLGNVVGYEIGRAIGTPLYKRDGRLVKRAYIDKTTDFFERYGNRAIVLGRFVPIVRTFITVVAGVGKMERRRFFTYSFIGALLWAVGVTVLGYFLGQISFVKNNLEIMLLLIVAVSLIPVAIEFLRHRAAAKRGETAEDSVTGPL